MQTILPIFYGPMALFIEHPERAYLIAIGFAILFAISVVRMGNANRCTQMGMLFAAILWAAFGLNEQQFQGQGQGANIRVDLLFSWPPLIAVSFATIPLFFLRLLNVPSAKSS